MLGSNDWQTACTCFQSDHWLTFKHRWEQKKTGGLKQAYLFFLTDPSQGVNNVVFCVLNARYGEAKRRALLMKGLSNLDGEIMALYRVWPSKKKQMVSFPWNI